MDNIKDSELCELKPIGAINSLRLWMIWMILAREPKALYVMNWSGLWMTWMTKGHKLRAPHAMNNLRLIDMNDSMLSAQGSRCYEQLRVVDDMNNLGSYELWSLDALNNSRLRMIWTIFCREPMTVNVMNNSGLWMTWTTQRHELRALDVRNNSGLLMTGNTPGHELRALDAMNSSRLWLICISWAHGFGCYELLGIVDDMNDLRSYKFKLLGAMNSSWLWMIWTILGHKPKAVNVVNT